MNTTRRLVTFLGTGNYSSVIYRECASGRSAAATPWVTHALAELYAAGEVIVLATSTAEAKHGSALTADLRTLGVAVELRGIPEGGSRNDLWQQFEAIKAALRAPSGCEVILDITHGFRSQPFFAAAVVAFIRAVDAEQVPTRVVYGSYEARDADNVAPVWELTPFVDLIDSAREIMLFLKTGRSRDVAARVDALGRQLRKEWAMADPAIRGPAPELARLAKALDAFGSDLETVRTGALLLGDGSRSGSAERLIAAVASARQGITGELPPLADVLDRIAAMAMPLTGCRKHLNTPEGHAAVAALARLYYDMGRYAEAATTVREGLVTLYAADLAACPGVGGFDKDLRQEAERLWQFSDRELGRRVAKPRNDIDHGGFRKQPLPAQELARQIGSLVDAFESARRQNFPGCTPLFVNISNHPSDVWEPTQRDAAHEFAPDILDVSFPSVPPDADGEQLQAIAEAVLAAVPKDATHAMIQGEFTLAFRLVSALKRRGVACYAATTTRDVVEEPNGDKTSRFAFVAFRPFLD